MKVVGDVAKGNVIDLKYWSDFAVHGVAKYRNNVCIAFAIIVDWEPLYRLITDACKEIPWIENIETPQTGLANSNKPHVPNLDVLYIVVQVNYDNPNFLREIIHIGEIKDILTETKHEEKILQHIACRILAKELDRKLRPKLREIFMLDV